MGDEFDVEEEIEATESGGLREMSEPIEEAEESMPEQSAEPEDE